MEQVISNKLDAFFTRYTHLTFDSGQVLISGGDEPRGIFYLHQGLVKQYLLTADGHELTLHIFKPHSFFPMIWAVQQNQNKFFYQAMTPIVVYRAPPQEVVSFIHSNPEILYDLLTRVFKGTESLIEHLSNLAVGSAYHKLISTLIILGERFGVMQANSTQISLSLTHVELGFLSGISRETISRELDKLKHKKLITEEKHHILIHDQKLLQAELVSDTNM